MNNKGKRVSVRVTDDEHSTLAEYAFSVNKTPAELIRGFIGKLAAKIERDSAPVQVAVTPAKRQGGNNDDFWGA